MIWSKPTCNLSNNVNFGFVILIIKGLCLPKLTVPSTVRFAFALISSCKEEKGKAHVQISSYGLLLLTFAGRDSKSTQLFRGLAYAARYRRQYADLLFPELYQFR